MMWRGLWPWVVVMLLLLGCGKPEAVEVVRPSGTAPGLASTDGGYTPLPTATSWPTFTPVVVATPTAVPVETPTVVPAAVPTVGATFVVTEVPQGTATVEPLPTEEPTPTPTVVPTPTPYGKWAGAPVFFVRQSLFSLDSTELPEYLESGDVARWPDPAEVISRTSHFVVWAVAFDLSEVADEFVIDGYVRWVDLAPEEPLVMRESEVRLSKAEPLFYMGLGRESHGFWNPGVYGLELLDSQYEVVVEWTFEVR